METTMPVTRHVIKIGGSLLACRETPYRVERLLASDFRDSQVNIILGGGEVIDALRALDAIHSFCPAQMHWWCIRAMRVTCEIGCRWFPSATPILTAEAFDKHRHDRTAGLYLIAVDSFYSELDGDELPQDWSTTSDSLAALLARKLAITRLTLLKSCPLPSGYTVAWASREGVVDGAFMRASEGLDVELRNLS